MIVIGISFFVIAAAICFGLGFFLNRRPPVRQPARRPSQTAGAFAVRPPFAVNAAVLPSAETEPPEARVTPETRIVYEYFYAEDGGIKTTVETVPYSLVGKTEAEVAALFPEWAVASFEPPEIVLRKTVSVADAETFVVGESGGYIAVFYEDGATLKEITDMPVEIFEEEERARLKEGIRVSGKTELFRVLQDYGS
jgi:hypothetical protein